MQESVLFMLEQLPEAHQLENYVFKYNPRFTKNDSLDKEQVNVIVFLFDSLWSFPLRSRFIIFFWAISFAPLRARLPSFSPSKIVH